MRYLKPPSSVDMQVLRSQTRFCLHQVTAQSATFRFRKLLASVSQQSPKSFAFLIKTCSLWNNVFHTWKFYLFNLLVLTCFRSFQRLHVPSFRNGRSSEFESNTCHIIVSPAMPRFLARPSQSSVSVATFSRLQKAMNLQLARCVIAQACKKPQWLYNWKELLGLLDHPRSKKASQSSIYSVAAHPPLKAFPLKFASALVTLVGQCRGSAEKVLRLSSVLLHCRA